MLNYGSNSNLILFFSAYSVKFLNDKKRKLKVLLDFPNYFFTITQLKEWFIDAKFVKRDEYMNFPCEEFIKEIGKFKPDVILLTTPNNPTGKPIKDDELIKIINSVSKNTIILIDRSCVNVLPEISTKELLAKFKNKKIVILHSFSKSHSLSDERLGHLATNSIEIAEFLYNKRDLNHNIHALKKLIKVLNDKKNLETKERNNKKV
jgi:histidinol-phosphate/aromatic aminotransferase/cobyric acid decarboxylase-like protein